MTLCRKISISGAFPEGEEDPDPTFAEEIAEMEFLYYASLSLYICISSTYYAHIERKVSQILQ